jgi:hypothetical protein
MLAVGCVWRQRQVQREAWGHTAAAVSAAQRLGMP